jgi:hypothetical protein
MAIYHPCNNNIFLLLIGVTSMQTHDGSPLAKSFVIGSFLLSTIDQLTKLIHLKNKIIICQIQKDNRAAILTKNLFISCEQHMSKIFFKNKMQFRI